MAVSSTASQAGRAAANRTGRVHEPDTVWLVLDELPDPPDRRVGPACCGASRGRLGLHAVPPSGSRLGHAVLLQGCRLGTMRNAVPPPGPRAHRSCPCLPP